jgi:TRAP transporter TAXI family solute receptor
MIRVLIALTLAAAMAAPARAEVQTSLGILTGAQGGVFYALGMALSQVYAKAIPNVKAATQVTRTSAENLNLLQAGRAELAFTQGDVLVDAWKGNEEAGFKTPLHKLRGLSAAYDNYLQVVARADSGIRTLADLKGKRVSVGVARSGTELNARALVKAAGLTYKDFAKVEYLPFGESMELMKDRQLDAAVQSASAGAASIRDLATALKIVIVPIPPDVVTKMGEGVYRAALIPANSFSGQAADVPTAAVANFLVTQSDVPDELAYQMTKALYQNLDKLYAASSAAKAMKRENAVKGMPVPLHPGAEKYYREVGVIR